jgi:hypothetical protein
MIVQIDREMRIKLLKALRDGYVDTEDLPCFNENGTKLIFSPTPLTQKDIEEIKRLQADGWRDGG